MLVVMLRIKKSTENIGYSFFLGSKLRFTVAYYTKGTLIICGYFELKLLTKDERIISKKYSLNGSY